MSIPSKDTFDKQFLKEQISSLLRERVYTTISPDVMYLMKKAYAEETSPSGKEMLKTQILNVTMPKNKRSRFVNPPASLPSISDMVTV